MIIMKFGGTSVQDAKAMFHVNSIASQYQDEPILIVSSACSGMTSELLKLANDSVHISDDERNARIDAMRDRHLGIAGELGIEDTVRDSILDLCEMLRMTCEGVALLGECTPRSCDGIAAYGELLSTVILNHLLQQHHSCMWFDARKVITTDTAYQQANIDFQQTEIKAREVLLPLFASNRIIITQGFIASDIHDNTTTLGRGGSDYSAALFGAALNAKEIIIWTDVSGIASADPRLIADAHFIKRMSFDEARMLSFFGAKVLHPETLIPALRKNIPVHVRNTFKSSDIGTTITQKGDEHATGFRSVIGKQSVICLSIHGMAGSKYHENKNTILHELLHLTGVEPMLQANVGDSEVLIYDAPIQFFKGYRTKENLSMNITVEEFSLISAIGPNLRSEHSKDAVKIFHETVLQYCSQPIFISGIQPNTLSALVPGDISQSILKELHLHCS